jgi:taurine transport system permease protein
MNTYAGTEEVDQKLRWSALSLGCSRRRLLRDVMFPSALPQILTGCQISAPIALIVALVAEFVMGGQGIGAAMLRSARYVDSVGVFAGIVEIGVLGYLVIRMLILVRRWALPWHRENA